MFQKINFCTMPPVLYCSFKSSRMFISFLYILNSIFHNSNFGFTAAATFFQSVIGTGLILISNAAVRKISPDNALF